MKHAGPPVAVDSCDAIVTPVSLQAIAMLR